MQSVPDFLSLDDRVSYLEENGYAPAGGVSDSVRDALRFINFHHFLGYARNYRNMIRKGLVEGDVSLDRLLVVIELDRRASALIFRGLQLLEWHLRALFVEHHCALFSTTQCFFEQSHYTKTALDEEPAERLLRDQVLRMKEPFIVRHFERWAKSLGLTEGSDPHKWSMADQDAALAKPPIWAIIDGWTMGLFVRVLINTRSVAHDGVETWLWKRVALDLSAPNQTFPGDLRGMIDLRNQVAHHTRLWMRPTTNSPKGPKRFKVKLRGAHHKSMYVAVMTLAALVEGTPGGREFLTDFEDLLEEDE